jgi:hypothetical protein
MRMELTLRGCVSYSFVRSDINERNFLYEMLYLKYDYICNRMFVSAVNEHQGQCIM